MKKSTKVLFFCLAISGIFFAKSARGALDPQTTVEDFITQAYAAMRLPTNEARLMGSDATAGFCGLVMESLDFEGLLHTTVFDNTWNKTSEEERQKFTIALKSYIVNQIAQKFSQYTGDIAKIQYAALPPANNASDISRVSVTIPGVEKPTIVLIKKIPDIGLRITEATYDGMGIVQTNRDQLHSVIAKEGLPKLTELLNEKSEDMMGLCK